MTDNLKWEPIPLDELTRIEEIVSVFEEDGECVLTVYGEIFHSMLVLPPGVRLCRGKPIGVPEPDWSQAPDDLDRETGMCAYNWWTVDANGAVKWHCIKPWRDSTGWRSAGWITFLGDGDDDTPGYMDLPLGVDWRTTLRQRPEYAE